MEIEYDKVLKSLVGKLERDSDCYHLGKVLLRTLNIFSDRINQIDAKTGKSETNKSILRRSIILALWMRSIGIQVGDVIMISAANHLDLTIVVVASCFIGAAIFPADIYLHSGDLMQAIELGQPKLLFCDNGNFLTTLEKLRRSIDTEIKIVTFGTGEDADFYTFDDIQKSYSNEDIADFKPNDFDPETTASFIYSTSGSTGVPKGVVMTHKTAIFRISDFWFPVRYPFEHAQEIFMSMSPFHWITCSANMFSSLIYGMTRIITPDPFTPEIAYNVIRTYKPTITLLGPSALQSMLEYEKHSDADWLSLRNIFVAGSVLTIDLAKAVQNKLLNGNLIVCYGMTEVCGAISSSVLERPPENIPLGYPRLMETKVVDSQGTEMGPDEKGELLIKSDFLFKEYYKNENATREAYTSEGWFKTGDIVYHNEDGNFFYVDRLKFMMKYKNYQISPVELENVILKHPSVTIVAVDRLKHGSDDLPIAFVVKKANAKLTEQGIMDIISEKLAPYKQLRGGVVFLNSMPLMSSGKIDRREIRRKSDIIGASSHGNGNID